MILKNQDGNTLIENIAAVCVLSILSAMIASAFVAGMNVFTKSTLEYNRVNDIYNEIESKQESEQLLESSGTISFEYAGDSIDIEGTYIYDLEKEKLNEFSVD